MHVRVLEDAVDLESRSHEMEWYWWAVIGVGVAVMIGAGARELPAIRRYLKMRSM